MRASPSGRGSLSLEEVASQAEVDAGYVRRLIELGALERGNGPQSYRSSDVRRVRLLHACEAAGLPVETVVGLVRAGALPPSWLEPPLKVGPAPLDVTYDQLCMEEDVPFVLIQALQEALGYAAPEASERAREGDRDLAVLLRMFLAAGGSEVSLLRLVRVYADSLRRVAKAEAEVYESQIERAQRRSGGGEGEILGYGARFGERAITSVERALLGIYRRHREHIWIEHCITHAEAAAEGAGLPQVVSRPPAICFVDLTGYTHITEEQGDEVAARLATSLASLVEDVSRRHGGRPIRWLGDGGMFHFKDPGAALLSGLEMVHSAPRAGLPPMHIGVHTGPVVFQDGDVYGRTVNLASRIASYAGPGHVLASDETVRRCTAPGVRFRTLGPVRLKGIRGQVALYEVLPEPEPKDARGVPPSSGGVPTRMREVHTGLEQDKGEG